MPFCMSRLFGKPARHHRFAKYHQRPAADGSGKWSIEEYFATDYNDVTPAMPLSVALDLKALYEQMLFAYI